jgi:hypothetical protein
VSAVADALRADADEVGRARTSRRKRQQENSAFVGSRAVRIAHEHERAAKFLGE